MTWWESAWSEWQEKQVGERERRAVPKGILPQFILFLASGFLSGFVPYLPGTAGTLAALACYALLLHRLSPVPYVLLLLLLIPLGSMLCGKAEGYLDKPDAAPIVLDEFAGYLTSVALLPYGAWTLWGGFFLFRLLDITKPPPIRDIQSLRGGWGVMADDLVAGAYANCILRLLFYAAGG